jgi:hypothetical protein
MLASDVDVDHDLWAERIEQQRREWLTQRARLRRELLEFSRTLDVNVRKVGE